MAVMKDLYTRLELVEQHQAAMQGRVELMLRRDREHTERWRRIGQLLELALSPAEEDHAPSVGGVLEAEARRGAAREFLRLLAEVGGGQ